MEIQKGMGINTEEMKKGMDGELGNFGRANIKSPAGAASQLLRIPADFDQTQDQR